MAAPNDKDATKGKHGPTEERTTERRLIAAPAVMNGADSTRDVAGEDFLFHLYRGSELLQDNRVLEAKEELEQALTLQPRDPKGQDLLAVVYFRIGLYPRAIQIYEQLKRENPRDASIKLNLALCYLKTGQTPAARSELEDVVRLQPTHKRAWGYLGLTHERLGELDKALAAFERGAHATMARRVSEKMNASSRFAPPATADAEARGVVAAAFEELDAGEVSFSIAEQTSGPQADAGTWKSVELGDATRKPRLTMPATAGWTVPPSARAAQLRDDEAIAPVERPTPVFSHAPLSLADVARDALIVFPRAPGVSLHPSGIALVRTAPATDSAPARRFAARLEGLRTQSGALTTQVMQRHARGKSTGESFGGLGSPLVEIGGAGEVTLGARASHMLVAFTVGEEPTFVREDFLLGFELTLEFDNLKLALGDGEAASVVQLRGKGAVLLELMEAMLGLEVTETRPLLVRHELVIGWTGQVIPRALPLGESPSGQRGLLHLAGAGTVFVASR